MMGVQAASNQLFYDFCLDDHVPSDLLRSIWPVEKARHDLNGCMNQFGRVSHAARIELSRAHIAKPISVRPGLVSGIAPRTAKSKPKPPAPFATTLYRGVRS